jgi:hypothetical protein
VSLHFAHGVLLVIEIIHPTTTTTTTTTTIPTLLPLLLLLCLQEFGVRYTIIV